MESHKPQSLRVKAVERLLDQLRQEGRLVVKPVVTHPPKLPYKRHNPNESGLKRYELKGGRYLIRSSTPRRNRKCKNMNCERLCQKRSAAREATDSSEQGFSEIGSDKSVAAAVATVVPVNDESSTTLTGDKSIDSTSTTESSSSSSSPHTSKDFPQIDHHYHHHHHHHHHLLHQCGGSGNYSEDDSQTLFFQMDHSMFYLSSLEDGFLTEEITEHV